MEFPTELDILTCLMLLAASLWIPYVVGIATDPSHEDAFARPADMTRLRPWVRRAQRAQANLLEQALPFWRAGAAGGPAGQVQRADLLDRDRVFPDPRGPKRRARSAGWRGCRCGR